MTTFNIGLDLPSSLKLLLTSVCYGLPSVDWVEEENFNVVLRFLGSINDQVLMDVKESLSNVHLSPFSIHVQGIDSHSRSKKEGLLWAEIFPNENIVKLKNEIDKALKGLSIAPIERSFKPRIIIGNYSHVPDHKLGEYLAMHSLYRSDPIQISHFVLYSSKITSKRIIHEHIEQYELAQ